MGIRLKIISRFLVRFVIFICRWWRKSSFHYLGWWAKRTMNGTCIISMGACGILSTKSIILHDHEAVNAKPFMNDISKLPPQDITSYRRWFVVAVIREAPLYSREIQVGDFLKPFFQDEWLILNLSSDGDPTTPPKSRKPGLDRARPVPPRAVLVGSLRIGFHPEIFFPMKDSHPPVRSPTPPWVLTSHSWKLMLGIWSR